MNKPNETSAPKRSFKAGDIIMTLVFAAFILVFTLALLIMKDREFSEIENRNLTQKPEFSFKNLIDGKFADGLESYISDQIFMKDELVSLKTDIDRLSGKILLNGLYFAKDGYLLQQYSEDRTQIEENISALNDFAEKLDVPVDFVLAPNSIYELSDKLPAFSYNDDQGKSIDYISSILSDKISLCDLRDTLKNEDYYYKTDHHWTSEGAKAAFEHYFETSGQEILPVDYQVETVKDFYGTLYSKAPSSTVKPDELHIYTNPNGKYSVEYVNEGKTADSLYDRSFLDKKSKYNVFFGDNYAYIKIKTNCESGKKALIIKDSYANSFVPFLADQYSEITMIDLRYYHFQEKTVSELCAESDADRVIMIYNMDFINTDRNFIWLE